MDSKIDVLIIGAGMAGLCAANHLRDLGLNLLIVDKGRGVGGRMATRRFGEASFDHGAQFLTAKSEAFQAALSNWQQEAVAETWPTLTRKGREGALHWKGKPSMTAIPKFLKGDLPLQLSTRITSIARCSEGWESTTENGQKIFSKAVIVTAPVPQALDLLRAAQVEILPAEEAQLTKIQYDPCFAVMATLDGPSHLPESGYLEFTEGPILCIVDNQKKGVSAVPAITLHASPAYSRVNWKGDREACGRDLLELAKDSIGAKVKEVEVHGWLYSKAQSTEAQPYFVLQGAAPLLLAGDAFGGPQVEGAALSGWAAAEALIDLRLKISG